MASKRTDPRDPYAPPPMYHDRSGRVVRIGLMAILLAALGVGYFAWSAGNPQQTAAVAPPAQQQLADAGYRAQPEQMPQAQPVAPTPPATAPAPTRRSTPARSSRTYSAPAESAPPVSAAPTTPAPPIPPATTTPQMPDTTAPG
jgi:hypothetical protein